MADRAMTPVVGKALEATLVVLYVGLVTAALYGGAVPEYRSSAGTEVAERALADAATDIERAVPPDARSATVRVRVDLPPTIAGRAYRVRAEENELHLDHPDPQVATTAPLILPDRVDGVSGTWASGAETEVRIETSGDRLEVRLE